MIRPTQRPHGPQNLFLSPFTFQLRIAFKRYGGPCLLRRRESFSNHGQNFKPCEVCCHLHVRRSPSDSTCICYLLKRSAAINSAGLIERGQLNGALAHQLYGLNCLATFGCSSAQAFRGKLRFRLHVFSKNLRRGCVRWGEVPPHPVGASNKLPDLSRIFERREVDNGLRLFFVMGRTFAVHFVPKQNGFYCKDMRFAHAVAETS